MRRIPTLDPGPYHHRRVVCDLCMKVLQDGHGPTAYGRCEYCAQRAEARRKRREAIEADPFYGFREEDGGE